MMQQMGDATSAKQGASLIGITSEEATRRLATDGPNELPTAKKRNLAQQAWEVVSQPMLLLLLGAGTVNFLLSEPLDGVILMSFVVIVIAISIYQEHKTENALAALRDLSSPRALVVRDGKQARIAGRDVVRGDVVVLTEGDRVPADAVLVDCVNFSVDESALTGESVPVRKTRFAGDPNEMEMGRAGGDATPWIFSGTLVVKGHGTALTQATGAASMALQSMLGLICDPVAARVEIPCLGKNVIAASNAMSCANMALAGFDAMIPFDEVVDAAKRVGERMPREHRCTSLGGLATTPTALRLSAALAARQPTV